jgi:hypothetical protein
MDLRSIMKFAKFGVMVPPQLADDGAFANNGYFDCQGLASVMILIIMGATDIAVGSDDAATPPKLEECDTTGGAYTAIPDADLSAVIGAGDDNKMYAIHVDRTATRKRYIQLDDPTAGNGSVGANMTVIAIGFPAETMPKTAAEMGIEELIEVI